MLRLRVLTALILLPVALAIILIAPLWLFDLAVLALTLLLAIEFATLCFARTPARMMFVLAALCLSVAAAVPDAGTRVFAEWLLRLSVAAWLLTPFWLWWRWRLHAVAKAVFGLLILAGAAVALHHLKAHSPDGYWVLLAFLLVWAADIGAYAAGRTMGRRKLAPAISPGKTWEGFAGGLLLAMLVGVAMGVWMLDVAPRPAWILLLLGVVAISVIGDLVESLLKRQAGVKDSGTLLPGHGGVLDRLDSLLAAAPVLALFGSRIGIFGGVSVIAP